MSDAKRKQKNWMAVRSQTCGHLRAGHNYQFDPKKEWTDADIRLINAAPDLLAACEAWDTGFVDGEQFDAEQFRVWVNERRAMARAAIAKAKGGAA